MGSGLFSSPERMAWNSRRRSRSASPENRAAGCRRPLPASGGCRKAERPVCWERIPLEDQEGEAKLPPVSPPQSSSGRAHPTCLVQEACRLVRSEGKRADRRVEAHVSRVKGRGGDDSRALTFFTNPSRSSASAIALRTLASERKGFARSSRCNSGRRETRRAGSACETPDRRSASATRKAESTTSRSRP